MPIRVQTPSHGIVEFPDGTDETTMTKALQSLDAPEPSYLSQVGDRFAGSLKRAVHNPAMGAGLAGVMAAPFTAGMSVPAAMAVMGAAGAGGSVLTGARDVPTIAKEGALSAAGEGLGRGVGALAQKVGKLVYKAALRPSMVLQKDFGDIAVTGLREGRQVSEGGGQKVVGQLKDLGAKTRGILDAKDAERLPVRGYLPPAQGVELGAAPIHPTIPELRDPRSAGVLLRDALPTEAMTGEAAHGSMVAPAEIARRGLGTARGELADRALGSEDIGMLSGLEQRFLSQNKAPFSLARTDALKHAEQDLAETAYKAQAAGHPINSVDARFHKGIARGAREAIEQRAPEVGPLNTKAQELIGLKLAIEDATRRNVPGVGSLRTLLGDFAPATASAAGIALNRFGARPAIPAAAFRTALLSSLGQQDE